MKNAVIIEDEPYLAKDLAKQLHRLEVQVVETIPSVEQGIAYFSTNPKVDLVFADIQLGDGLSFEIFEKVNYEGFIIFTTAFEEYSLKAFAHNSIDYLLKPIQSEHLQKLWINMIN